MENMDKGLTVPKIKMGADKSTKSTPNAPEFICPNCLSKPKNWYFDKKGLHWASVVRDLATCIPRNINLVRVND